MLHRRLLPSLLAPPLPLPTLLAELVPPRPVAKGLRDDRGGGGGDDGDGGDDGLPLGEPPSGRGARGGWWWDREGAEEGRGWQVWGAAAGRKSGGVRERGSAGCGRALGAAWRCRRPPPSGTAVDHRHPTHPPHASRPLPLTTGECQERQERQGSACHVAEKLSSAAGVVGTAKGPRTAADALHRTARISWRGGGSVQRKQETDSPAGDCMQSPPARAQRRPAPTPASPPEQLPGPLAWLCRSASPQEQSKAFRRRKDSPERPALRLSLLHLLRCALRRRNQPRQQARTPARGCTCPSQPQATSGRARLLTTACQHCCSTEPCRVTFRTACPWKSPSTSTPHLNQHPEPSRTSSRRRILPACLLILFILTYGRYSLLSPGSCRVPLV